jgi:diguanylate cyclase (GGDEF)-like protein
MSGFALWAYKSIIDPLRQLESKLNSMDSTLELDDSVEDSSDSEISKTTKALNKLLNNVKLSMNDIIEQRDSITYLANHDQLTGLFVWRMGNDILKIAIEHARRRKLHVAILFLDLDGFKLINDTYGHDAGDEVLKESALRIKKTIRLEDAAIRLGGDEFVVILGELTDSKHANMISAKITEALSAPILYNGTELYVGASTGIAIYPENGEDIPTLLRSADTAMYEIKKINKSSPIVPVGWEITGAGKLGDK